MTFETLRDALADKQSTQQGAEEARVIATKALEDARTMIDRMDEQVTLHVARVVNVTIRSTVHFIRK